MSTKESEIAADTFRRVLKNDLFESGESPNTSLYGEDTQLHLLRMFPEPEAEAGKGLRLGHLARHRHRHQHRIWFSGRASRRRDHVLVTTPGES